MRIEWNVTVDSNVYASIDAYNESMARGIAGRIAPPAIEAMQKRVSYWKSPPQFEFDVEYNNGQWRVSIWPVGYMGMIWDFHVQGVKRRVIKPRFRKALRFKPSMAAGPVIRSAVYEWPGIKSRKEQYIDAALSEDYVPTLRDRIAAVCRDAFREMQDIPVSGGRGLPGGPYAPRATKYAGTPGVSREAIRKALEGISF